MKTILRPKNLPQAVLLLAFVGACAWAWQAAGGSFANLWLTPDQRGARLMARRQYAEAAKYFQDPLWQGVAEYRDGQFKEAAAAFARIDSPEAAFDRGNALLMHGKYGDAIASYDRALQRRLAGARPRPTAIWRKLDARCWSRPRMTRAAREGK
jgi:Ca-activated chloride channel homolog